MEQALYHHGIKGQKWGIRRFQNPDGSLTEAGKRRYRKSVNSILYGKTRKDNDYSNLKEAEAYAKSLPEYKKLAEVYSKTPNAKAEKIVNEINRDTEIYDQLIKEAYQKNREYIIKYHGNKGRTFNEAMKDPTIKESISDIASLLVDDYVDKIMGSTFKERHDETEKVMRPLLDELSMKTLGTIDKKFEFMLQDFTYK